MSDNLLMLLEMIEEVLEEQRLQEIEIGSGTARDLEGAITAAVNNEMPNKFPEIGKAIASVLKTKEIKNSKTLSEETISPFWKANGGSSSVTKADLLFNDKIGVSVKFGASQLMSGQSGEANATAATALEKIGITEFTPLNELLLNMANNIALKMSFGETKKQLKNDLKAGVTKLTGDKFFMNSLLSDMNKIQKEFEKLCNESPEFKKYFTLEAMSGQRKFNNKKGTAHMLLTVAGKKILGADEVTAENIGNYFLYKQIDEELAQFYAAEAKILIKFKTDSIKDKTGKKIGYKGRQVVGLMVRELSQFIDQLDSDRGIKNERMMGQMQRIRIPADFVKNFLEKTNINNLNDLRKLLEFTVDEDISDISIKQPTEGT